MSIDQHRSDHTAVHRLDLDVPHSTAFCIFSLCFVGNQGHIAAACRKGSLVIYDTQHQHVLHHVQAHAGFDINSVVPVGQTGHLFATGADDSTCCVGLVSQEF